MKPLLDVLGSVFWSMSLIAAGVYGLHLYRQEGYDEGYSLAAAQGDKALAMLGETHANERRDTSQRALDETNRTLARLINEQERADQLAKQLADTQRLQRQTSERLTGEINRVTTLYRRALNKPPEPLPAAVFTTGFVRVWNSANGIAANSGLPAAETARRAAAPSDPTTAADQLDSGVSQGDVLINHTRNAELHASCRAQLNSLINWNSNANQ